MPVSYTHLYKAVEGKMEGNGVYGLYPLLMQGAQDAAKHVLEVFGAAGKAWDVKTKSLSLIHIFLIPRLA